jgi:DNA-binding CsgD family transcriptional regulator
MKNQPVSLGPREHQIVELLLQGCGNAEIARELKMAPRTVKAHFNRLYLRFGIIRGVKPVKLATLMYRRQTARQMLPPVRQSLAGFDSTTNCCSNPIARPRLPQTPAASCASHCSRLLIQNIFCCGQPLVAAGSLLAAILRSQEKSSSSVHSQEFQRCAVRRLLWKSLVQNRSLYGTIRLQAIS